MRRHAVGGGRGVAEVAARRGAALHLRRADQVGASTTPGQALPKRGCSASAVPETAAPITKPPSGGFLDRRHLGDLLDVDDRPGRIAPARICTSRSVPPARMRAALPAAAKALTASASVVGARYRASVIGHPRACPYPVVQRPCRADKLAAGHPRPTTRCRSPHSWKAQGCMTSTWRDRTRARLPLRSAGRWRASHIARAITKAYLRAARQSPPPACCVESGRVASKEVPRAPAYWRG